MTNFWNWVLSHWGFWASSGAFGFAGGLAGGTVKWFVPSRKEWAEGRKAKREAAIDSKVLSKLRAMCEGNSSIYGTDDIAEEIGMTMDETADSLERLEIAGRVQMYDCGTMDDPGPGWRSRFR